MNIKELNQRTGGLSNPSKMPGFGYGLPASRCIMGSLLRSVPGSVCSKCYALKGRYVFPNVQTAQEKRFRATFSPTWVEDMTELIARKGGKFFRWHDSGDIQSVEHLSNLVQIAKNLPNVKFWLPTRERKIVQEFLSTAKAFPRNFCVRVSAATIGRKSSPAPKGVKFSTVGYGKGFQCPAYSQGGECKNCRACWDKRILSVNYPQH